NDPQNDVDGDGISGHIDNCPTVSNPSQANADGDGMGDACDPDDDNDGVLDGADVCPGFDDTIDTDADGIPDGCDAMPNDNDNDGVNDGADVCPGFDDTIDTDADGIPDGCDAMPNDNDNDGVNDGGDNCPTVSNPAQTNTDGDSMGDACDPDDDNDGVLDAADTCPITPNWFVDADADGIDDACDPNIAIPSSGGGSTAKSSGPGETGGRFVIPVTGRQVMKIDCANPTTIMQLDNSNRVLFNGLCGYDGVLETEPESGIAGLKPLPAGMTFVSGMNISILQNNSPVKPLPDKSSVTVSFFNPQAAPDKKFSILFWDAAAGDWVKLPAQVTKDGKFVPTDLYGDTDADKPEVLDGVHTSGYRLEVTLNFGGIFILAAE
ncbi:MAG: thrombospondin type 3 repeat-containing protein, partial [Anaerolineaceae bacterium]|nr:thrombospondin type 3 repeat-containing protein [Anaerolineaceae bacterium]